LDIPNRETVGGPYFTGRTGKQTTIFRIANVCSKAKNNLKKAKFFRIRIKASFLTRADTQTYRMMTSDSSFPEEGS